MPATCEYRFDAKSTDPDGETFEWTEVTEEFVCQRLAAEGADPRELNDILIALRRGEGASTDWLVFRAVHAAADESQIEKYADIWNIWTTTEGA